MTAFRILLNRPTCFTWITIQCSKVVEIRP